MRIGLHPAGFRLAENDDEDWDDEDDWDEDEEWDDEDDSEE